jgi:hypothetical protein
LSFVILFVSIVSLWRKLTAEASEAAGGETENSKEKPKNYVYSFNTQTYRKRIVASA